MPPPAPTAPAGSPPPLRRLAATRYVTALREGGSVPAVVEADDGQLYVAKFHGAAQGPRALVAELIVGELARAARLPVPELGLIEVDPALGRSEPHEEIRQLLLASAGLNLAMGYLAGAVGYDVAAKQSVAPALASAIVALDIFAANVDRTARNPNLLWWKGDLWMIDHGAALYWHHAYDGSETERAVTLSAERPFALVADHVLLPFANALPAAGHALAAALDDTVLERTLGAVPDEWLQGLGGERARDVYLTWLRARAAKPFPASSTRQMGSGRHAFDYVLVQVVPRVDRDERLNAGVILFCPAAAFLGCRFVEDDSRWQALGPELDLATVGRQLAAIAAVCAGAPDAGPIAQLPISERFHWLTAPRSTVVQPSAAHTGLCDDAERALDRLFQATFGPARPG